jgi:hypothetical protein
MQKLTSFIIILVGCFFTLQSPVYSQAKASQQSVIEVIQFHLEHRCFSCNKMEEYSKLVLKDYPGVPFKLYNVEDKKNEKIAEQFKASGTALFLYNPKTGRKKDLTGAAFMSVGNQEKFVKELKKNIDDFQKSL